MTFLKHFMQPQHVSSTPTHPFGFVTLLSVLVVGVIGIAICISLVILSIDAGRSSLVLQQQMQAIGLARACSEAALQRMNDDDEYTGTTTLTIGAGTCSYTIQDDGGEQRTIFSTGTVMNAVRKEEIIIADIQPYITITTWQEVADF